MERSTIFLIGKPSISIRAIYTMAMLNNQRVVYSEPPIPRDYHHIFTMEGQQMGAKMG